jgi:hypothetical protein
MYALSPTLFELLTDKLSPCNMVLAQNYPNIEYALLNTLYSHCSRYDHFIASSTLFLNSTKHGHNEQGAHDSTNVTLLRNAPTRDHFKQIIEILTKVKFIFFFHFY